MAEGQLSIMPELAAIQERTGIKVQGEYVMSADMPNKLKVGGWLPM